METNRSFPEVAPASGVKNEATNKPIRNLSLFSFSWSFMQAVRMLYAGIPDWTRLDLFPGSQ
jgi:hypothetical protein